MARFKKCYRPQIVLMEFLSYFSFQFLDLSHEKRYFLICKTKTSKNSLHPVDFDGTLEELHHCSVQLHGDFADGGQVVHHLPPHLDVEILKVTLAQWTQDKVTGGGELEDIAVKGLEMVVSPCAAHLAIVCRIHSWVRRTSLSIWQQYFNGALFFCAWEHIFRAPYLRLLVSYLVEGWL